MEKKEKERAPPVKSTIGGRHVDAWGPVSLVLTAPLPMVHAASSSLSPTREAGRDVRAGQARGSERGGWVLGRAVLGPQR